MTWSPFSEVGTDDILNSFDYHFPAYPPEVVFMSKPNRKVKKANHGKRPANAKGRKLKRNKVRT